MERGGFRESQNSQETESGGGLNCLFGSDAKSNEKVVDFVDLESTKMETINRVSYKVFAWSIRRGDIALNCRYQAISRFDLGTGGGHGQ
jgi:hypothetical protein